MHKIFIKNTINVNIFNPNDWSEIVARPNYPLFNSLLRIGATIKNKEFNFDNRVRHQLLLNPIIYSLNRDLKKLEKNIFTAAHKNNFLLNYLNKIENDCDDYLRIIKIISKTKYESINNKKLSIVFANYIDQTVKILSHLYPIFFVEKYIIGEIENNLKQAIKLLGWKKNINYLIQTLISPGEPSTILKRKIVILKLAAHLKEKDITNDNTKILEFYNQFNWLNDHTFTLRHENLMHFVKEILKEKNPQMKLAAIASDFKKNRIFKKQIIKKYNLDNRTITLCRLAERLPNLRAKRLEVLLQAGHLLKDNLFNSLSKNLAIKDIRKYYYWEIAALLNIKIINKNSVEKRTLDYGFYIYDKSIKIFSTNEGKKLRQIFKQRSMGHKEVKGSVAYMGIVSGKVRIVTDARHFCKFKKGEILVTFMTTPEFVPIMIKAAGIITDEGGISCHAAIVSRELKIPCIVGTKIATQVLKDGDLVEVDAERGIVKLLKKKTIMKN